MLRLVNLALPLDYTAEDLRALVSRKLRVPAADLRGISLVRESVDARDKADVHFVLSVDVSLADEASLRRHLKPGVAVPVPRREPLPMPQARFAHPPVVVGAGPAGLFAALILARAGACPILIERGKAVEERTQDVQALQENAVLDPESNVQFGEGGAGAFSDGKLTTGIKSPWQREVLDTFVRHGAPEEILWLQKPHIGTDRLKGVVASIRGETLSLGGDVRFSTRLTELRLQGHHLVGIVTEGARGREEIRTDALLLCIGHSARDTLQALFVQGVRMTQKPFAMGVRIEHPQQLIDQAQYGPSAGHPALRHAEYKLHVPTPDGRGVYSFCMCPGGLVIASASQPGGVVTNGMSFHARDGVNANAALLVGVRPEDFGDDHPLAGFVLQRQIEKAAFALAGGGFQAPAQRVEDFLRERPSRGAGDVLPTYRPGVVWTDLHPLFPEFITRNLAYAMPRLDGQLHGFALPDAVMTAPETRSSSPVRLPRDADGMAEGITGLYPAGEGAGYAGGITSAAVDGINAALKALENAACP